MLTLYKFNPAFGQPDPSPFCLKVETYLRMVGIEYSTIAETNNLRIAPKGKLPFIKDGEQTVADSEFIIDYLNEQYGCTLDKSLTKREQAVAHLTGKSLDEGLYFIMVYFRWYCDETWPRVREQFFGGLPPLVRNLVPRLVRKGVLRTLHGQGISRHSRTEILQLADKWFQSIDQLIDEKPFCFGDAPSSLDATVYAFLAEILLVELDNDLKQCALQYPRLLAYCQRIQQTYFNDTQK